MTGCLGCITQQGPLSPGPVDPQVTAKKEADLPKRTPKAATCVAFGDYRAGEATDDKLPLTARHDMQEQARKAYQQALAIDPGYVPAYLGLANLYISEEDYTRALDTYHKAVQKNPKNAQVWEALGMCHARKKEWEPALTALKRAVELNPENRQYTRTLGLCLARAGRTDDSVACLTKVMNQAEAYFVVARMLHHLQREDDSKRYARMALQAKPDLTAAREFLAYLENPGSAPPGSVVTAGLEDWRPQATH